MQRTFNDKVEFLMSSDGVDALYRYNTSLLPVVSRDPFLLAALTSGFMNSTLLLTFSTIIQINLTHIRMI